MNKYQREKLELHFDLVAQRYFDTMNKALFDDKVTVHVAGEGDKTIVLPPCDDAVKKNFIKLCKREGVRYGKPIESTGANYDRQWFYNRKWRRAREKGSGSQGEPS